RPDRPCRLVLRAATLVAVAGGVRPRAADRAVEAGRVSGKDVQELREVEVLSLLPLDVLPVVRRPEVPLVHLRRDLHRALLVEVVAPFLVLRERLLVEHLDRLALQPGKIHRAEGRDRLQLLRAEDRAEAAPRGESILQGDAGEADEILPGRADAQGTTRGLEFLARLLGVESPPVGRVLVV